MIIQKDYFIRSYLFTVLFGNWLNLSFSKVSNLSSSTEYEIRRSAGRTGPINFANKPADKASTITFERGVMVSDFALAFMGIKEGLVVNNIIIFVEKDHLIDKIFCIDQGIITKTSFSDLDAENGKIMIQSLEMAHSGLYEI